MGYKGGDTNALSTGLRADSLKAPIAPYEQISRRGLGVGCEEEEDSRYSTCTPVDLPLAIGADQPFKSLLQSVLQSMQQAGDSEEADELSRLAACVGSVESVPTHPRPSRKRQRKHLRSGRKPIGPLIDSGPSNDEEDDDSDNAVEISSPVATEALKTVLHSLRQNDEFPVEASEQQQHLSWKKAWAKELGPFEDFVGQHDDELRLIQCPAPHGALVLPREVQGGWSGGPRYMSWCRSHRLAATGKAKKKWKHIEKLVERVCRWLVSSTSRAVQGQPMTLASASVATDSAAATVAAAVAADEDGNSADEDDTEVADLGWFADGSGCD